MEKRWITTSIVIQEHGEVAVERIERFFEGDTVVGSGQGIHRHVIEPGDRFAGENARVRAVCELIHTPEVVSAYRVAAARDAELAR